MNLLSDKEEWELWNAHGIDDMNQAEAIAFARAYAAAILAKLAGAELSKPAGTIEVPSPVNYGHGTHTVDHVPAFTADQLHQAYAQGAAANPATILSMLDRLKKAEKDAFRLVWAMNWMCMSVHDQGFAKHVLERGGTGDYSDCVTYIDAAMEASK